MENSRSEKKVKHPGVSPITSSAMILADMHLNTSNTADTYEIKFVEFGSSVIGSTVIKPVAIRKELTFAYPSSARAISVSPIIPDPTKAITIFWRAARDKRWELVKELIEKGHTDLNISPAQGPNRGLTALWFAVQARQWDLVQLLVARGASISNPHFKGTTELENDIIMKRVDGLLVSSFQSRDLEEIKEFTLATVQAFVIIEELKSVFNKPRSGDKESNCIAFKRFVEKNFVNRFMELENIIIGCCLPVFSLKFKLYDEIISLLKAPACSHELMVNLEKINSELYFELCEYNNHISKVNMHIDVKDPPIKNSISIEKTTRKKKAVAPIYNDTLVSLLSFESDSTFSSEAKKVTGSIYGNINSGLMQSLGLQYYPSNKIDEKVFEAKRKSIKKPQI